MVVLVVVDAGAVVPLVAWTTVTGLVELVVVEGVVGFGETPAAGAGELVVCAVEINAPARSSIAPPTNL